mmetsp:Transcript_135338/g.270041  ORF Transcript_135338/g.270041 Transcript_135338/m.270041 type:complete len:263 (-) Transcript_135338:376-1164(-)
MVLAGAAGAAAAAAAAACADAATAAAAASALARQGGLNDCCSRGCCMPGVPGVGTRRECRAHGGEWDARLLCEAEEDRHLSNTAADPLPLWPFGVRHVLSDFTDDARGVGVDLGVVTKGARGPSCQSLNAPCLHSRGLDGVGEAADVVARRLLIRGVTGASDLPAKKGASDGAGGGTDGDGGLPRTEGGGISTLKALLPLGAVTGSSTAAAAGVSRSSSCDGSHADMRAVMLNGTGRSWRGEGGDNAECCAALSGCNVGRGD